MPIVIAIAALIGLVGGIYWRAMFILSSAHSGASEQSVIDDVTASPAHVRPSVARAARVIVVSLLLWWGTGGGDRVAFL